MDTDVYQKLNLYLSLIDYIQKPEDDISNLKQKMIETKKQIESKELNEDNNLCVDLIDRFREILGENTKNKEGKIYYFVSGYYFSPKLKEQPKLLTQKLFAYFFGAGHTFSMSNYLQKKLPGIGTKISLEYFYEYPYIYLDEILENVLTWRVHHSELINFEEDFEPLLREELEIYLLPDLTNLIFVYLGSVLSRSYDIRKIDNI